MKSKSNDQRRSRTKDNTHKENGPPLIRRHTDISCMQKSQHIKSAGWSKNNPCHKLYEEGIRDRKSPDYLEELMTSYSSNYQKLERTLAADNPYFSIEMGMESKFGAM